MTPPETTTREVILRALCGPDALKLATVIARLALRAGELGELEEYQFVRDDVLVTGKRFPALWFDRLARAAETGALAKLEVERIVEIMLSGPR